MQRIETFSGSRGRISTGSRVAGWPRASSSRAAYGLRAAIEAHADDGERLRRLPMPTVKALVDADLMRMCVPAIYGGPEADPMTMVAAIEAVSAVRTEQPAGVR